MNISETTRENLAYGKKLIDSGIEGANDARKAVLASGEYTDLLGVAAKDAWQSATFGALAGALFGALAEDDCKPVRSVVAGSLLGALLGFAGGFAWKTRPLTSAMSYETARRMRATSDERWLAKNPINYG